MHEFKHPKYYKELRKRNKSDQAISLTLADGCNGSVRPGPGHKPQASSGGLTPEASSGKRQAPAGGKPQAASLEKQASSPEEQASSLKP